MMPLLFSPRSWTSSNITGTSGVQHSTVPYPLSLSFHVDAAPRLLTASVGIAWRALSNAGDLFARQPQLPEYLAESRLCPSLFTALVQGGYSKPESVCRPRNNPVRPGGSKMIREYCNNYGIAAGFQRNCVDQTCGWYWAGHPFRKIVARCSQLNRSGPYRL